MKNICFATVTSEVYDDQAAGLYLNLRNYYHDVNIVLCTIDEPSYIRLKQINDNNLLCVKAADIWGNTLWDNVRGRMNGYERANATKAALAHWILNNYSTKVLILDNDLLFLKPIDDIIDKLKKYAMLITPIRRSLSRWKRTQKVGLFQGGFVGFSKEGIHYAYAWKKLCFNYTRELFEDSLFYDQKYRDYFVGLNGVYIVVNTGINVTGSQLRSIHIPYCDEKGIWRVKDGSEIIVFHNMNGTPREFPLSILKQKYDMEGAKLINLKKPSNVITEMRQRRTEVRQRRFLKTIHAGRIFFKTRELLFSLHVGVIHIIVNIERLLLLNDMNIFKRLSALINKNDLMRQYFDD